MPEDDKLFEDKKLENQQNIPKKKRVKKNIFKGKLETEKKGIYDDESDIYK